MYKIKNQFLAVFQTQNGIKQEGADSWTFQIQNFTNSQILLKKFSLIRALVPSSYYQCNGVAPYRNNMIQISDGVNSWTFYLETGNYQFSSFYYDLADQLNYFFSSHAIGAEVEVFIYEPYRNTGKIGFQLKNSSALDSIFFEVNDPASQIDQIFGLDRGEVYEIGKAFPFICPNPCNLMPISSLIIQTNAIIKTNQVSQNIPSQIAGILYPLNWPSFSYISQQWDPIVNMKDVLTPQLQTKQITITITKENGQPPQIAQNCIFECLFFDYDLTTQDLAPFFKLGAFLQEFKNLDKQSKQHADEFQKLAN